MVWHHTWEPGVAGVKALIELEGGHRRFHVDIPTLSYERHFISMLRAVNTIPPSDTTCCKLFVQVYVYLSKI